MNEQLDAAHQHGVRARFTHQQREISDLTVRDYCTGARTLHRSVYSCLITQQTEASCSRWVSPSVERGYRGLKIQ